jgi:hypothetical protein
VQSARDSDRRAHLPILHGRALSKHHLGVAQVSARDVDHRRLKVKNANLVQRQRARRGMEPFAPHDA